MLFTNTPPFVFEKIGWSIALTETIPPLLNHVMVSKKAQELALTPFTSFGKA
jgi:hypothetical protein